MSAASLSLVAALLIGGAPLLGLLSFVSSRRVKGIAVVAWLAGVSAVAAGAARYAAPRETARSTPITGRPVELALDGYVSSKECRSCHEAEYGSWHASFHRRMTQVVRPETVQSQIDGTVLSDGKRTWRLFRKDDSFFVEMDEPEWDRQRRSGNAPVSPAEPAPRVVHPIVMSTGSHHYEALWYSDETTRKVSLVPFCWRVATKQWLPVDAAFLVPPDEHQGSEGRWNIACNRCHSTHPRARVSGRFDMQTDVAEFGIACESCHGPGERHVREQRDPAARYARHLFQDDSGAEFITNPDRLAPERSSMVCGQCHAAVEMKDAAAQARWNEQGTSYRPGGDFRDERRVRDSGAEKFWSDGMIRTSGREYNGLLHSPCANHGDRARGVMTCLSCHEMHPDQDDGEDARALEQWADDQLTEGMRGDRACTQCHTDFAQPAAIEAHTHHAATSSGSRCMDCHMPYVTYGLLKSIRSHTIANPSLAESIDVGRPNACSLCHLDRTLEWAGEKLESWYGQAPPATVRAGSGLTRDERELAAGVLWITRGDAGQRALVACAMQRDEVKATAGADWFAPYLARLLQDPYAAVRLIAHRSLESIPAMGRLPYDFAAPPAARAAATASVRQQWELAFPAASRIRADRVLIDSSGRFDDARLEALVSQRDDRRVVLAE